MSRAIPPERRALPLAGWPARDRMAWEQAIAPGDVLDGHGPAAHWRRRTRDTNVQHYGRWLAWLALAGQLDTGLAPALRATPECVRAYAAHLETIVAPRTRLAMLVGLKVTLQAMAPEHPWRWLQDYCNAIQRRAGPVRNKTTRLLHPAIIHDAAINLLRALPVPCVRPRDLIDYRDGLLLALLALRPLRVGNVVMMELGRHLVPAGPGRWRLRFAPGETKNHAVIDQHVPASVVPWLERYLAEVRPALRRTGSARVWINSKGDGIGHQVVWQRITRLTRRLLGIAINPHLLRDCAATMLADHSPEAVNLAGPLLGHRNLTTAARHYVHADQVEAGRTVEAVLSSLRTAARQSRGKGNAG